MLAGRTIVVGAAKAKKSYWPIASRDTNGSEASTADSSLLVRIKNAPRKAHVPGGQRTLIPFRERLVANNCVPSVAQCVGLCNRGSVSQRVGDFRVCSSRSGINSLGVLIQPRGSVGLSCEFLAAELLVTDQLAAKVREEFSECPGHFEKKSIQKTWSRNWLPCLGIFWCTKRNLFRSSGGENTARVREGQGRFAGSQ